MRMCVYCGESLDGLRADARYCHSGHRAAAWRARSAERAEASATSLSVAPPAESPQSRSQPFMERLATAAEEREIDRVRRKLAEWERAA
jgi:hypothetical protein